jgi:drug/metabolite transporter (DMT)-like permease
LKRFLEACNVTRAQANGLLVIAAFLWGAGNVAQKTVLEHIGPLTAVGCRCLIAALVLAPFFARFDHKPITGEFKSALYVIVTFAIAVTLYQISAGLTSVTNAGFLVNISIVTTPVAGWLLLRQKPEIIVWPAGFFALVGAYMMSGGLASRFNFGDALAMAAAVLFSFWMIFLGRFVTLHGQAGLITLVQFFVTGLLCLTFGLLIEPVSFASLNSALPELIILGVASTAIGYLFQAIAQTRTSASEASIIVSGEAIFGAIFAFALLGETLSNQGLIGALLIICGIGLVQLNPTFELDKIHPEGGQS